MLLVILIVVCALLFDYINGFHDTANAIATVISTRVHKPRTAILMAASLNFIGALCFTQVAATIAKGLVIGATQHVILAAILGAIVWNLTMGHKIIRLEPVHGFAAETAASLVILYATLTGNTVSTTHVISGSIFGVGAAKRLSAVRWQAAQSMLIAWVLTIPSAATVAAVSYLGPTLLGVK